MIKPTILMVEEAVHDEGIKIKSRIRIRIMSRKARSRNLDCVHG